MTDEDFVAEIAKIGTALPVMLGSGLSVGAGLPTWPDLFNAIHGNWPTLPKIGSDGKLPDDYDNYYEYAEAMVPLVNLNYQVGRAELKDQVAEFIKARQGEADLDGYRLIAKMEPRHILSLNYDGLMYQVLDQSLWHPRKRGEEIRGTVNTKYYIALHGSVDDPNSMVLTSDDLWNLFEKAKDVELICEQIYNSSPVLHVGLGFRDWAFFQRFNEARLRRQGAGLTHYAIVTADVSQAKCDNLERQWGIRFIRREVAEIPPLLEKIGRAWDEQRQDAIRQANNQLMAAVATSTQRELRRYHFFHGRPPENLIDEHGLVDQVYTYLSQPQGRCAGLIGPVACGKTAIARTLADRALLDRERFPGGVCWFGASGHLGDMVTSILRDDVVPAGFRDQPEKAMKALADAKALYVIDDVAVDHLDAVETLLNQWLRDCSVLLLSQHRRLRVADTIRCWEVKPLSPEQAVAMFLRSHGGDGTALTTGSEGEALRELVSGDHFFAGNPGAIIIAARHIAYGNMRVEHYRDRLRKRLAANRPVNAEELLSVPGGDGKGDSDRQKRESYFLALDMSMQGVFGEDIEKARNAIALAVEFAQEQAFDPLSSLQEFVDASQHAKGGLPDISVTEAEMAQVFQKLSQVGLAQPMGAGTYVVAHPTRRYAEQKSTEIDNWRQVVRSRLIGRSNAGQAEGGFEKVERLYGEWQGFDCDTDDYDAIFGKAKQALETAIGRRDMGWARGAFEAAREAQALFEMIGEARGAVFAFGHAMYAADVIGDEQFFDEMGGVPLKYDLHGEASYLHYIHYMSAPSVDLDKCLQYALSKLPVVKRIGEESNILDMIRRYSNRLGDVPMARWALDRRLELDDGNAFLRKINALDFAIDCSSGEMPQAAHRLRDALEVGECKVFGEKLEAEATLIRYRLEVDPWDVGVGQEIETFAQYCQEPLALSQNDAVVPVQDSVQRDGLHWAASLRWRRHMLRGEWDAAIVAAQAMLALATQPHSLAAFQDRGSLGLARLLSDPADLAALEMLRTTRQELARRHRRVEHLRLEMGEAVTLLAQDQAAKAVARMAEIVLTLEALGYTTRLERTILSDVAQRHGVEVLEDSPLLHQARQRRLQDFPPILPSFPPTLFHPQDGRCLQLHRRDGGLPYYRDIAPVSFAQYRRFLDESGFPRPLGWGDDWPSAEMDDLPVRGIDHREARAFAHWRGMDLPMSAEVADMAPDGVVGGDDLPSFDLARVGTSLFAEDESVAKILAGLSASLSLSRQERMQVISAVPTLYQFQVDEMARTWREEVERFKELETEHPEEVRELRRRISMVNSSLTTYLPAQDRQAEVNSVFVDDGADNDAAVVKPISEGPFPVPALYCVARPRQLGRDCVESLGLLSLSQEDWHLQCLRDAVFDNSYILLDLVVPHLQALSGMIGDDLRAIRVIFHHLQRRQYSSWVRDAFSYNVLYEQVFARSLGDAEVADKLAEMARQAGFADGLTPRQEADELDELRRLAARVFFRDDLDVDTKQCLLFGLLLRGAP